MKKIKYPKKDRHESLEILRALKRKEAEKDYYEKIRSLKNKEDEGEDDGG